MDNSRELNTLIKFHNELAILIRNSLDDIAVYLRAEEVISHKNYREVTDKKSVRTDDEKAVQLLHLLEDKVEEDTSNYSTFWSYIASKDQYSKITAEMNNVFKSMSK